MGSIFENMEMKNRLVERGVKLARLNTKTELAVDRGLAAALLINVDAGIAIMLNDGVPVHVVSRVMHNPELRRGTDWKHYA